MKKLVLTAALSAACLGLAACGEREADTANNMTAAEGEASDSAAGGDTAGAAGAGAAAGASAGGAFPKDARIVEEGGVTYRVDADGTRVRLGDTDSRIVVENGTRFRVDPDGSRVRIGNDGVGIDIDTPDVDLPDVDVGVNRKGNLDVDVTDRDRVDNRSR